MGTGLEQGCRRLIFFLLLKKSSSKLTKGTILKKLEELFEESIIGIFKKKKIWQFKTHKNGESISENKILKHENRLLLHPALSMQLLTDQTSLGLLPQPRYEATGDLPVEKFIENAVNNKEPGQMPKVFQSSQD